MTKKEAKDITSRVMAEIHEQNLRMRPRLYFVIGSALLGLGSAGLVLSAVFFTNLVLFHLRIQRPFGFLAFGSRGFRPFLTSFPLLFLLLAVLAFFGGVKLIRKYDFSYRKGFWGTVIGLAVFVLSFGFLLDRTSLNERARQLKPLQPLYREQPLDAGWLVGEVVEVEEEELVVQTPRGEQVRMGWDDQTELPAGSSFREGEKVRAVGEYEGQNFEAEAIRPMGPGPERPRQPRR